MIYKADINELPLSVFIEVYTNENHTVKFDIPNDEAVPKVVGDYMAIVGGKQLMAEVVISALLATSSMFIPSIINSVRVEKSSLLLPAIRNIPFCRGESPHSRAATLVI